MTLFFFLFGTLTISVLYFRLLFFSLSPLYSCSLNFPSSQSHGCIGKGVVEVKMVMPEKERRAKVGFRCELYGSFSTNWVERRQVLSFLCLTWTLRCAFAIHSTSHHITSPSQHSTAQQSRAEHSTA